MAFAAIAAGNGGTVLEVGYGMGLSACDSINGCPAAHHHRMPPKRHRKVQVRPRLGASKRSDATPGGFLGDASASLGDATLDESSSIRTRCARRSSIGITSSSLQRHTVCYGPGVLTYYSDEATDFSEEHRSHLLAAGFDEGEIDFRIIPVTPPEGCEYWR